MTSFAAARRALEVGFRVAGTALCPRLSGSSFFSGAQANQRTDAYDGMPQPPAVFCARLFAASTRGVACAPAIAIASAWLDVR